MHQRVLLVLLLCCSLFSRAQDVHQIEKFFEGLEKENLGKAINSKAYDISPAISPDGQLLYFSRFEKGSTQFYQTKRKEDGSWAKASRMGYPFDKIPNAIGYNTTPDGHMILMRGVFKNGKQIGRGYSLCSWINGGWSDPKEIPITNYVQYDKGSHFSACFAPDERTLIMEMDSALGSDYGNLYVSFYENDTTWSEPLDLGPMINSPETISGTPFLAADGRTLYFASNRYETFGGVDLFVTHREDDSWTNWTLPQNLGPIVNGPENDLYFSIPASGDFAYLVSSGDYGNHDIFRLKMPEEAKPEPVELVKGHVKNGETQSPIETKITVHDMMTDKEIAAAVTDAETGFYEIILPRGMKYTFYAEEEGYYSVRENLDLTELDEYTEVEKDLYLYPFDYGQEMLLNNVFFVPTKDVILPESIPELTKLFEILDKNGKMRIRIEGHTDNTGESAANLDLSQRRAEKVREFLMDQGISGDRLEAQGFGERKPLNDNSTEELRRKNRRVQFVIIK